MMYLPPNGRVSTPRDIHHVRTGAETVTHGPYRAERVGEQYLLGGCVRNIYASARKRQPWGSQEGSPSRRAARSDIGGVDARRNP